MTGHRPAFGLSFDPRALADLLHAPDDIRDLVLAHLKDIIHARLFGTALTRDLAGYRKIYIDDRNSWRMVYCQRPAPAEAEHRTEIHVVAVRPRYGGEVYAVARDRLGLDRSPATSRAHAARTRSPQLTSSRRPDTARSAPPLVDAPVSARKHRHAR
ncbi:hypothetical protein ACL02R_11520 [Streptomyces sp. MS19]|uniref:hypothetical protein n=1 Tax=Streptomyces sp. MS19 TaxID=3385972 RepID=UPI0039A1C9EF